MKYLKFLLCLSLLTTFAACKPSEKITPNDGGGNKLATPAARQDNDATTAATVKIVWDAVADAAGYNCIFDGGESSFTDKTFAEYTDLQPASSHTFRVQAVAADKEKHSDSDWSAEITVKTAEEGAAPFVITINPDEVTFFDAAINVAPADEEMYYFVNCTEKLTLDSMSDSQFVDYTMQLLNELAEASGKTFGDIFIAYRSKGVSQFRFPSLDSDTEYYAFAFGFTIEGEVTTRLVKEPFRTKTDPGIQPSAMTFDIAVPEKSDIEATVEVTPSVDDEYYFFTAIHSNNKTQIGSTDEEIIAYYIALFNDYLLDMSFEDFAAANLSKGTDSYTFTGLEAGNEYLVLAFGVTPHGNRIAATTALTTHGFIAENAVQTEEQIRISITECTSVKIDATFTPLDMTMEYTYDIQPAADYAGMSDEQIIAKYLDDHKYDIAYMTSTGVSSKHNYTDLTPDTDYIVFAFGVDVTANEDWTYSATATTPLYKKIVRTLP